MNQIAKKSKLSSLRETHGVSLLSSLKNIQGGSGIQKDALLQGTGTGWPNDGNP